MTKIRHCDLQALSSAVFELQKCESYDELAPAFVRALDRLFRADYFAINWFDQETLETVVHAEPEPFSPSHISAFETFIHEHPSLPAIQHPELSPVVKWTDFTTLRQFRNTDLYNEFFHKVGIRHQLALAFLAEPQTTVAVVLNRKARDFSEEERAILQLLSPHFREVYRRTRAAQQARQTLLLQELCLGSDAKMVITVAGLVLYATEYASQICRELSGETLSQWSPKFILRWIGERRKDEELVMAGRDGRQYRFRCSCPAILPNTLRPCYGASATRSVLLVQIEEICTHQSAESLLCLGLSAREAEVLYWVAQGKRNTEIATIIGAKTRTVDKHMENVFVKLQAETRAAAVAMAWEVFGRAR